MMSLAPSSPRLPSPPPAAEIQIGPASPSGGTLAQRQLSEAEAAQLEMNSKRRVHPGTKASDMAAGPPLMPLNELDSAFQLQEHLAALHYYHSQSRTQPITRTTAIQLATPPASTDRTLWLYELCRFLISQCNSLIVGFLFDTPPCSATTCPEMRASEWQFLCAVHEQPKSCCAIDYCCHTLDWAANVVTDPKIFPSRLVALQDAHSRNIAMKNLVNVFRRLHRIFAHAWFQHRSVFWSVENQTGLYVFFKTVCDMYDLLPGETYKLPPEAEGLESDKPAVVGASSEKKSLPAGAVPGGAGKHHAHKNDGLVPSEEDHHQVGKTNTRRHIRSNPSTGSAVTTVMEADEEESPEAAGKPDATPKADITSKMEGLQISAPIPTPTPTPTPTAAPEPEPAEEEPADAEEIPVIVEQDVMEKKNAKAAESTSSEVPAPAEDPIEKEESKPADVPVPEEPTLPPEDSKPKTKEVGDSTKGGSKAELAAKEDVTPGHEESEEPSKADEADDSESEEHIDTPDSGSTSGVSVQDFAGELSENPVPPSAPEEENPTTVAPREAKPEAKAEEEEKK